MARIATAFSRIRDSRKPGLVAYVTAGDPDARAHGGDPACRSRDNGADVLEVGVPFSDPLADGPVIQRASERALASGSTLTRRAGDDPRDAVGDRRRRSCSSPTPIPSCAWAKTAFVRSRGSRGVDGVLVLDLPVEEAGPFRQRARGGGARSDLPARARRRPDARIRASSDLGSGFLYVISRLGVTGARDQIGDATPSRSSRASGRTPTCRSRWASVSRRRSRSRRSGGGPTRRWSAAPWSTSSRNMAPSPDVGRPRRRLRALAERTGVVKADLEDLRQAHRPARRVARQAAERARRRARSRSGGSSGTWRSRSTSRRARPKCCSNVQKAQHRSAGPAGDEAALRAHHRRGAPPGADRRRSHNRRIKEGSIAMVVVMRERASDDAGAERHRQADGNGLRRAPVDRRAPHGARRGRRIAPVRHGAARGAGRRAGSAPDHRAATSSRAGASSRRTR